MGPYQYNSREGVFCGSSVGARPAYAEAAGRNRLLPPARQWNTWNPSPNLERVVKIEPYTKDSRVVVPADGAQLPVSRAGYTRLQALLEGGA